MAAGGWSSGLGISFLRGRAWFFALAEGSKVGCGEGESDDEGDEGKRSLGGVGAGLNSEGNSIQRFDLDAFEELQFLALFGEGEVESLRGGGGFVLLLDEAVGEVEEGVFVGGVGLFQDFLGGEFSVGVGGGSVSEGAALFVLLDGDAGHGLTGFQGFELDAGVFVEGGVVRGEVEGVLEGELGLVFVALLEELVALLEECFGFLGAVSLAGGFLGEVVFEFGGKTGRNRLGFDELQVAVPVGEFPLAV